MRLSIIGSDIQAVSFPRKLTDFRQLIESNVEDPDIKTWLVDLLSHDIEGDSEQILRNSQFLMEAGRDHYALFSLVAGVFFLPIGDVRKESVDRYDDISFLDNDDYSIMGVYNACIWFDEYLARAGGSALPEQIPAVERGIDVNDKLSATIKRLSALTQASQETSPNTTGA